VVQVLHLAYRVPQLLTRVAAAEVLEMMTARQVQVLLVVLVAAVRGVTL
jgi:hypothetical protein